MRYTRRGFLEAAGTIVAAAGFRRSIDPPRQFSGGSRQSGAPGVELNVDGAALPDYSHDLER